MFPAVSFHTSISDLDHAKSADKLQNIGIDVWKAYEFNGMERRCYDDFMVDSFILPHNGVRNRGFYIRTDGQRLLYMTDFEYCPYTFQKQKVQHMLVECNYSSELVNRDLPQYAHKILGHASLETLKEFIRVNKTEELRTVILCHMGLETLDEKKALSEISEIAGAGVTVTLAEKGKELELSEVPF